MVRRVIHIDQEKCNGCGICANACHEGAIGIVDGKAQLLRDDYCDGLGDCLPTCPTGAITFVEREAAAYDEAAVKAHMERRKQEQAATQASDTHSSAVQEASASTGCPGSRARQIVHDETPASTGCPGSRARQIVHEETPAFTGCPGSRSQQIDHAEEAAEAAQNEAAAPFSMQSQLTNWPVQIKLAPVRAPYFNHARLLIAADCTAYAYANFHQEFLKGKVALIGCPKLDDVDYSEKLTEIIRNNDIQSVTIVRMEVPCCGGLQHAAMTALQNSGKFIPWQVVTISIDGKILDQAF
ncbi:ferredoxin [Clostridium sp. OF09-36]|uniref:ATP-binding protein n=1 Tax=Clostridium sp. OF09-36 TaxID=2292310 RepID=UPI000E493921|nr:4Fe-4S binding protein [Clostridium sp. OF09-36]RHV89281.1 ferredoxin [Clostridium sp. OF09-36]